MALLVGVEASGSASTVLAEARELDAKSEDGAECPELGREREVIQFGRGEVADDAAADTDVVVMGRGVGIEVDGVAELPVRGDEVEIVKEPQGPTNSVEGD